MITKSVKNNLVEVLLEIRFEPVGSFPLIVGSLNEKLSKKYKIVDDLKSPDFPDHPDFNNIVRFRFYTDDKKNLYNIGKGILSINTVQYNGYDNFITNIRDVVENHINTSSVKTINRIGLRYINRFELKNKSDLKLFNIKINTPASLEKIQKDFSFKSTGQIDDNFLTTRFSTEKLNTNVLFIDFDCYSNKQMNYTLENVVDWANKSHEIISSSYADCLSEELVLGKSK